MRASILQHLYAKLTYVQGGVWACVYSAYRLLVVRPGLSSYEATVFFIIPPSTFSYRIVFEELSSTYAGAIDKVDIDYFKDVGGEVLVEVSWNWPAVCALYPGTMLSPLPYAMISIRSSTHPLFALQASIDAMSSRPSEGGAKPKSRKGGRTSAAAGMALKLDTRSDSRCSRAFPALLDERLVPLGSSAKGISSGTKRSSEPGSGSDNVRRDDKVPRRRLKSEGGHSPHPSNLAFSPSVCSFELHSSAGSGPAGLLRDWPVEPCGLSGPHPGTFSSISRLPDGKRDKAAERIEETSGTPAFSAMPLAFSSPRMMQDLINSEPTFGKLASDSRLLALSNTLTGGMGQPEGLVNLLPNGGGSTFVTHQPCEASHVISGCLDQQPSLSLHTDQAMAMLSQTTDSQQEPLLMPLIFSSAVSPSLSDTDFEDFATLLLAEDPAREVGNTVQDMDAPRMLDLTGFISEGGHSPHPSNLASRPYVFESRGSWNPHLGTYAPLSCLGGQPAGMDKQMDALSTLEMAGFSGGSEQSIYETDGDELLWISQEAFSCNTAANLQPRDALWV